MRTFIISLFFVACAAAPKKPAAVATINPLSESGVRGNLSFTDTKDGVLIQGIVAGLPPHSSHGFHVHEVGDCSSPEAPKGHFNPAGEEHGAVHEKDAHIGDLGNMFADDKGVAKITVLKQGAKVKRGAVAYLGRSVIVHEGKDDLESQPAGDSGKPAACGVIEKR